MKTKIFNVGNGKQAFIEAQEVSINNVIFSFYVCFLLIDSETYIQGTTNYPYPIEESIDNAIPYLLSKSFKDEERVKRERGIKRKQNIFGRNISMLRRTNLFFLSVQEAKKSRELRILKEGAKVYPIP